MAITASQSPPRRTLLTLVMVAVLGAAAAAAWLLQVSSAGRACAGAEIIRQIRSRGLSHYWDDNPRIDWYLIPSGSAVRGWQAMVRELAEEALPRMEGQLHCRPRRYRQANDSGRMGSQRRRHAGRIPGQRDGGGLRETLDQHRPGRRRGPRPAGPARCARPYARAGQLHPQGRVPAGRPPDRLRARRRAVQDGLRPKTENPKQRPVQHRSNPPRRPRPHRSGQADRPRQDVTSRVGKTRNDLRTGRKGRAPFHPDRRRAALAGGQPGRSDSAIPGRAGQTQQSGPPARSRPA